MLKRISLLLAVALMAVMMLAATAGVGFSKITPAQPADCVNGGGKSPGGQEYPCQGEGQTEVAPTCAQNPQKKCPGGHN